MRDGAAGGLEPPTFQFPAHPLYSSLSRICFHSVFVYSQPVTLVCVHKPRIFFCFSRSLFSVFDEEPENGAQGRNRYRQRITSTLVCVCVIV